MVKKICKCRRRRDRSPFTYIGVFHDSENGEWDYTVTSVTTKAISYMYKAMGP